MPDLHALTGFGCAIDSMIAIPGALPRSPGEKAGKRLRIELSPDRPAARVGPETFERCGDHIVYDAPSVARFECMADRIKVTPVVGALPVAVTALLVANALPATLWLRHAFLLHAAVLQWPGSTLALAICAPSSGGKSMLAAQWLDQGASLVADDVLAMGINDELQLGAGLAGGIHLPADGAGTRPFLAVPPDRSLVEARLGTILVLERLPLGEATRLERLSPIAAVEALLQNRYRPALPALMGRPADVLSQTARLAASIPVWRWRRPEGMIVMAADERDAVLAACQASAV